MPKMILSVAESADRGAWLKIRNKGLGGSDAGAIMGLNPYMSPYQLWLEKTGQVEPEDLSDNEAVYWGTVNEPNVARRFTEVTGKKLYRRGTLQSDTHPFMLANVDRMIIGEHAGLECKTANAFAGKSWKDDEIPASYYCQCLHYMAVTGADMWYIAVLLGGNHFEWKPIPRNDDDVSALVDAETEFWRKVKEREAPDIDGSESCTEALKNRYATGGGEAIDLPDEAAEIFKNLDELNRTEKALKKGVQLQKNKLMAMLGDAEIGTCGDRKVTWKASAGRESVDLKKLKSENSELLMDIISGGFIKQTKGSRILRIS